MKLEFARQFLKKKSWHTKFAENLPNERRIVPCGQTDGGTDMTKLMVAFRSFANASKKHWFQKLHVTGNMPVQQRTSGRLSMRAGSR